MSAHYARYDAMDLNYRVPYPTGYEAINLVTDSIVTLELSNGVPGSSIYYTTDGSEPDGKAELCTVPLTLAPDDEITLKSVTVMPGGRRSAVMTGLFRKAELKEASPVEGLNPGLNFHLYRGEFNTVEDFTGDADTSGTVATVKIPAGAPAENFGLLLEGFIMAHADGIYSFFTGSDDGVRVYIDGELVVDGDELHHGITNEGRVALRTGLHRIEVRYFQRYYRQSLSMRWEGPGAVTLLSL